MDDEPVRHNASRPDRALVVDPYPISRAAVVDLLRGAGIVDDIREATSENGALTAVRQRAIDLAVLDAHLEEPHGGLQLCRRLKRLAHPPTVLMFTGANCPSVVTTCMANGADGFVHRSATPEQFVDAVQSTVSGRPVWYLGDPLHERGPTEPSSIAPLAELTGREQEVLTLLLGRYTNEEIATELRLAMQTVKNLVSSILQKTGAANRRELIKLAGSRRPRTPIGERRKG